MSNQAASLAPLKAEALTRLADGPHPIAHGFFTRLGGVSTGVYAALNCGLGSNDDRSAVLENRRRVAASLGAEPNHLLTCHQIHSATAVLVDKPWLIDKPWTSNTQPKADALVTKTRGLALGALAADCTPVLFADPVAGVIAAAHAGWKGALTGVIEATLLAMEQAGASRANITAAIGPCISQQAYEVGPEFEAAFTAQDPGYGRFFRTPHSGTRAHFDLPGFIAHRLTTARIGAIENASRCTYGHPDQFFSYRRTTHAREPDYGRQISAVILR